MLTGFRDLPLRWQLLTAFGLPLLIMATLCAFAIRTTDHLAATDAWVEHTHHVIDLAHEAQLGVLNASTSFRGSLVTGRDEFLEPYTEGRRLYQERLQELQRETADNPAQVRRWQEIEQRAATWQRDVVEPGLRLRRDVSAGRAGLQDLVAFEATGEDKRHLDGMRTAFAETIGIERQLLNARLQADRAAEDELKRALVLGTLVGFLLAALIAYVLARVLTDVIARLGRAAAGIAAGRLDQSIDVHSRDEMGRLADSFRGMVDYLNGMADAANAIAQGDLTKEVRPRSEQDVLGVAFQRMAANLRDIIAELQEGAQQLSAASQQIVASVSQRAASATERAAAIAETTATVDEVKASADQTVQIATVVSETAERANRAGGAGVAAVSDATTSMRDLRQRAQSIAENILALSEQSQQIGEIITSVNDLADQSNLLALNAAIEASRAGEHGKGFAVVAAEIRNLAEQSKSATAQVRMILSDIQRATQAAVLAAEQGTKGVDAGAGLIEQAGETIHELAGVSQQAAQAAQQIAAAVRQHSVGMEQIALAMANVNQTYAENAARAAETKASADNLSELAGRLDRLVAQYRV
jgi:methyl-accepting chemotaxis protein